MSKARLMVALGVIFLLFACAKRKFTPEETLLNEYLNTFRGVSAKDSSFSKVSASFDAQEQHAESLKGQVSRVFYGRYKRVLAISRMIIDPKSGEKELQEVAQYISAVNGSPAPPVDAPGFISAAADALIEEVWDLDTLVTGETNQDRIRFKNAWN